MNYKILSCVLIGLQTLLVSCGKQGAEHIYDVGLRIEYIDSTRYPILRNLKIYKDNQEIFLHNTDKSDADIVWTKDDRNIACEAYLYGQKHYAYLYSSITEDIDMYAPKHTRSYQVYLKLPTIFGSEHTEEFEISYEVKHRIGTPRYAKYKGEILKTCPMENTSEIDALYRSGKAFAVFSKSSFIKLVIPVDTAGIKPK